MPVQSTTRPASTEHSAYFERYISQVPDGDVLAFLESQGRDTVQLLRGVDEKRSEYRYAPGKWTVRGVVGHITDSERVFAYRALSFARGDLTELPSFDENAWALGSNADQRSLRDLAAEFAAVRGATTAMFRGFSDADMTRSGVANKNAVSVRALAWIIAGHERHHVKMLRERYGL